MTRPTPDDEALVPADDFDAVVREVRGEGPASDVQSEWKRPITAALHSVRDDVRAAPSVDAVVAKRERLMEAVRHDVDRSRMLTSRHRPVPSWFRTMAPSVRSWGGIVGVVAAIMLVVIFGRASRWQIIGGSALHGATRTYATTTGQRATITLSDGSRVTLAPRTTIRVRGYGDRSRTVDLEGEAYFDVSASHGAPFIVRTGAIAARVLGTTFLMEKYPGEKRTRVVVTGGKVAVTDSAIPRSAVTLTAGRAAELTDSATTVETVSNVRAETGWLDDELVFHEAPMPDVLAALSRWYGYEFQVTDPRLRQQRVTVWLSTRSSAKALSTLKSILNASITVHGDTVTLAPAARHPGEAGTRVKNYDVFMSTREVGR